MRKPPTGREKPVGGFYQIQYNWYVPLDDSTAVIMNAFLQRYKATGKPLLLAKACVLTDSITRVQHIKNGMLPTRWMSEKHRNGDDFWISCMIHTALYMTNMADEVE